MSGSSDYPKSLVTRLLQQGTSSSARQSTVESEQTYQSQVKDKVLALDTTTESRKIASLRLDATRRRRRRNATRDVNDAIDFDEKQELFRRQFVTRRRGRTVRSLRVRPRLHGTDAVSFKSMSHLNRLWKEYIDALSRGGNAARGGRSVESGGADGAGGARASNAALSSQSGQLREKVMRADLHGAMIRVVQSRNSSVVGLVGIVLVESKLAFQIVTRNDCVKMIPKQHTVFDVYHPSAIFRFFGDQLLSRAAERSTKKFKSISNINDNVKLK